MILPRLLYCPLEVIPLLISARQYALRHGVHPNTVYHWVSRGLVPVVRVDGPRRHRYMIQADQQPPRLPIGRPRSAFADLTCSASRLARTVRRYLRTL